MIGLAHPGYLTKLSTAAGCLGWPCSNARVIGWKAALLRLLREADLGRCSGEGAGAGGGDIDRLGASGWLEELSVGAGCSGTPALKWSSFRG